MLCVCQFYRFNSTIPRAQFFLLLVTSASKLPVRTIRLCSVVFGVTSSLAVIHNIRGRPWLCTVRDRAWSVSRCGLSWVVQYPHTKLAAGAIQPWCSSYWSQSQIFVENRDFSLPHLHSTLQLRRFPSKYCPAVWYENTRSVQPDGEKSLKICLFVLTECTNVTDTQTHTQTDTAWRLRPRFMLASRGKNY